MKKKILILVLTVILLVGLILFVFYLSGFYYNYCLMLLSYDKGIIWSSLLVWVNGLTPLSVT